MTPRHPALPFVLPLLAATAACGSSQRAPVAPEPGTPVLSVMTFNVNYGIPGDRDTIDAIHRADADVVLLQETTPAWEAVLRTELSGSYPHLDFHHCCGAGGLGVASRYAATDTKVIEPPQGGWFPAWRMIIHAPFGPLQVLNVHLRPQVSESGSVVSGYFSTPPIREQQIQAYYRELDESLPTLIVGDFNEGAGGRAIAFLRDKGFRSALPEFGGSQQTWHWPTSLGQVSAQLDHLVYDDHLEPLDVRVIHEGHSDHYPVVGLFRRQLPRR